MRDLIDRHGFQPLLSAFANWIGRLQRCKWLQHFQIFDARYLITLDGSRFFSSKLVKCEHCLTTTKSGVTHYHHDILQAAIVHPDNRQVLPLAPEFVRNSDAKGGKYRKQDCEITAGYRMLERLRVTIRAWRQLSSPTVFTPSNRSSSRLTAANASRSCWSPNQGTTNPRYQDVAVLRRGNLLDRFHHRAPPANAASMSGSPICR